MGAAARTMLALYCANAAVGRLAATPARAGPTPLAARALTVEGGAREATHDAVETENRERLRAAGVTSQNTLLRRRPAPHAARALIAPKGSTTTREAGERAREGRDGTPRHAHIANTGTKPTTASTASRTPTASPSRCPRSSWSAPSPPGRARSSKL